MKEFIRLKSFSNGIRIVIDEKATLDDIVKEIKIKFQDSEKFFANAKLAVSFEGRENTEEEENAILDAIGEVSSVHIVCIASSHPDKTLDRPLGLFRELSEQEHAIFLKGDIKKGQNFESEESIIVLGNVSKGATVVSQKNIIVLGKLEGEVYAGADGMNHFAAALLMEPEELRIGEFKMPVKKKSIFNRKKEMLPKLAYIKEKEIVIEDLIYTEELLQSLF